MSPMELVGLLDEVFMCFDLLVEKYRLEKIKTIGDAIWSSPACRARVPTMPTRWRAWRSRCKFAWPNVSSTAGN